jgi:small Trp-rich protein
MWALIVGVILLTLKLLEYGPVAQWSWWWILAPFAVAAVWWSYVDASGITKRREMDKIDAKRAERKKKNMDALGIKDRRR